MNGKHLFDSGNYDVEYIVDDGRVWVRPSLAWSDGEVYESPEFSKAVVKAAAEVEKDAVEESR